MAQAAREADLDPDRLSFTEGLFYLTEMNDLALTWSRRGRPSRCFGVCDTRWHARSCHHVAYASTAVRSSRCITSTNPRSATCLRLCPLSLMISFSTLSICSILSLCSSLRRPLSEMYWALPLYQRALTSKKRRLALSTPLQQTHSTTWHSSTLTRASTRRPCRSTSVP